MSANNGLDGVLTLQATPSVFYNECEIVFKLDWKGVAQLPSDVNVQVNIRTLYTSHYTLYSTLYTVHCTLYTVHYTLYSIHYTLYTIH